MLQEPTFALHMISLVNHINARSATIAEPLIPPHTSMQVNASHPRLMNMQATCSHVGGEDHWYQRYTHNAVIEHGR